MVWAILEVLGVFVTAYIAACLLLQIIKWKFLSIIIVLYYMYSTECFVTHFVDVEFCGWNVLSY